MKTKKYLYGLMGLLSLLGFIGVFTDQRGFLGFFGFAVDFEYFFIKSDEMVEEYMNKSASRAFYCGMVAVAASTLVNLLVKGEAGNNALSTGITFGWAISIIVYTLSTAYYGFCEKRGLEDDKE